MRQIPYAWVIVLTLSVTELISWGALYYSFGVLLTPMAVDLGWSRAELSGGFSIGLLVAGLAAIPLGSWVDRRGPRLLMSCGSILGVAMLLAWSQVHSIAAFYLVWAGIGLASAATLYEPAFATVAAWFWHDRAERTRALAVLTFFGGLASLAFIPLTGYLADQYGWRGALIWLAGIVALGTILPHSLLLRPAARRLRDGATGSQSIGAFATADRAQHPAQRHDRPLSLNAAVSAHTPAHATPADAAASTESASRTRDAAATPAGDAKTYAVAGMAEEAPGAADRAIADAAASTESASLTRDAGASASHQAPTALASMTLREAVQSAGFWWLSIAFSLMTLVVVTLNVHLVSYLISAGHPSSLAALAAGAHGLFSVTGRLTLAPLAGRMSIGRLLALLFLLQVGALVALLFPSIIGVAMYVVLFGIGSGAATPVRAALIAERYGHSSYGGINGALTAVTIWARVAAPVGAGLLATTIGYPWLLGGLVLASLIATGAVLAATRRSSTSDWSIA